jgi:acetyl-CoA synthetase
VDRNCPLLLIYTSGTDGRPVGLVHSHDAMRGYLMTARWVLDLRDGDVLWTQGRPGWFLNAAYSAFAPWLCGVESVVSGMIHTAEEMYRHLEHNRVSVLYTVPTIYRMLADAGKETAQRFDLGRLRHLLSVLEPLLPADIYAVMRVLGMPVYDTWWSAETGMITIANMPCLPVKPGYLGRPVPGITAAVLDAQGQAAAPFTMGRLALQAPWPAMATGVWRRPELYQRYFGRPPWFMPGDTAFMDHDRYLFYQGRADDVVVTPAGKIAIAEIEHALEKHPAVGEAGLVRVAGRHGARLKAYVHLRAEADAGPELERSLCDHLARAFSPDIVPQEIRFCGRLPRDADGRLLRMVLKAWELGLPVGSLGAPDPDAP